MQKKKKHNRKRRTKPYCYNRETTFLSLRGILIFNAKKRVLRTYRCSRIRTIWRMSNNIKIVHGYSIWRKTRRMLSRRGRVVLRDRRDCDDKSSNGNVITTGIILRSVARIFFFFVFLKGTSKRSFSRPSHAKKVNENNAFLTIWLRLSSPWFQVHTSCNPLVHRSMIFANDYGCSCVSAKSDLSANICKIKHVLFWILCLFSVHGFERKMSWMKKIDLPEWKYLDICRIFRKIFCVYSNVKFQIGFFF